MGKAPKKKRKPSAYNRHIGREMKAGRTMKQAAASWKGKSSKKSSRKASSTKKTTKGGRSRVGKKGGFNTQKLFKIVRYAALAGPAAAIVMGPGDAASKADKVVAAYTGYAMGSGTFDFARLQRGWMPYLGAVLTTYGIPKLAGLIRGL